MLFVLLVFFLIGLLSGFLTPFLLLLAFLPGAYLFHRREKKKVVVGLSLLALGFLLAFFLPKGTSGKIADLFLVVERKESYCLLFSFQGRYLLYDKEGEFTLFSLVRIQGVGEDFDFSHFEQQFDFGQYLQTKGVYHILQAEEKTFLFRSPFDLSSWREHALTELDEDSRILADSLLFGASLYDLSGYKALTDLGLVSSMALGGFHLSFLLSVVNALLGKKRRKIHDIVDIVILLPFLFLSSFRFAVRRIFLTRLFSAVNRRRKKRLSSLDLLSLVCFLMLLFEPFSLLSSSFLYSFPFLFFIRLFPIKRDEKLSYFRFFIVLTLFFLPLRLSDSYSLSLIGPFLQIVAMPLSHLIFLLSLFLLLCPPLGIAVNALSHFLLSIADWSYHYSPLLVSGKIPLLLLVLFYALFLLSQVLRIYRMKKPSTRYFLLSILILSSSFLPDFLPHEAIYFVDVDQGDCTLVRHGRKNFLIDTGGSLFTDMATECLVPFLTSLKVDHLEAVLITHFDWDHYGALESLQENFPVEKVLTFEDFLESPDEAIEVAGLPIRNLNTDIQGKDSNGQSGVYLFSLAGKKILIMGDATKETELEILKRNPDLDVDILKVGHHGSDTSSSEKFLRAITPEVAILSVGENNSYGHPSQETLETLSKLGIPYRRTDQEGTITYQFSLFSSMIEA